MMPGGAEDTGEGRAPAEPASDTYAHRQVRPPEARTSVTADRREEQALLRVLDDATSRLTDEAIDHVVMGGVAVTTLARPRWTHDIDLFLRPDDAARALQVLADAGYETDEHDPLWLFKAWSEGVLVDLIFASEGGYYLDEPMLERSRWMEFRGQPVRVLPPEDLLVIKVAAHKEDAPHHWFDALALLVRREFDWDYLLQRAQRSVRRVLSLLLYAESLDIAVPPRVVTELVSWREQGGMGRSGSRVAVDRRVAQPGTGGRPSPGDGGEPPRERL